MTVVVALCSKWQPVYFIVVSLQKVVFRVIVFSYARALTIKREVACNLNADFENQCLAAMIMCDLATLLAGVTVICVDLDPYFSPVLRRCAQRGLALCLFGDAVGSYVWGNDVAGLVSLSVSSQRAYKGEVSGM